MADPPILTRLIEQIMARGTPEADAREIAIAAGVKAGNLHPDGTATEQGKVRGAMTPAERAIDRAVKENGGTPDDYIYHESTNSVTMKLKFKKGRR